MKRCFKPESFGKVVSRQIHCFSDASTLGYGHVSYLRQVNDKGEIHCAFLVGKARLAPLKIVTVPRLELTAAVLSARIGTMTMKELDLPIDCQEYWTDSQTVLRYKQQREDKVSCVCIESRPNNQKPYRFHAVEVR